MREFEIQEEYEIEDSVSGVIEEEFGTVTEVSTNHYVVEDPTSQVLTRVDVKLKEKSVLLGIDEASLNKADFSEVPEAVKSKNRLLRELTGRTVSDRKEKMREEVLPDKEWIEYGTAH